MAINWFKKQRRQPSPEGPEGPEGRAVPAEPPPPPDETSGGEPPLSAAHDPSAGKSGLMARLKRGLSKTRDILNTDIEDLFRGGRRIDEAMLEELEELLITADIGVQTSMDLMERVSRRRADIQDAEGLKRVLKSEIASILDPAPAGTPPVDTAPRVVMVVGVNGVGKTTTVGKLAAYYAASGKKVLIGAADTFRAAAVEQLSIWSERAGAQIVRHRDKADPAAVAYDAVEAALARRADMVLIDTAGRLHTKVNLMEELKKIKRSVAKRLPGAPHETLLVLDATTGQNALSQAKLFDEAIELSGLILTKLDGTAKGGIVVGICSTLHLPLRFVGVGEQLEDLQPFDPQAFADALF